MLVRLGDGDGSGDGGHIDTEEDRRGYEILLEITNKWEDRV